MLKACCRIRQPSAARIGVCQNTRNCWEFRDESHRAVDWARGVLAAKVEPQQGLIAFVKDGSIGAEDGQCMVRMQRSSGSGWVRVRGFHGHLYWPLPARLAPVGTGKTKREKLNCRSGKWPCDKADQPGHFQVRSIACKKLSRWPEWPQSISRGFLLKNPGVSWTNPYFSALGM